MDDLATLAGLLTQAANSPLEANGFTVRRLLDRAYRAIEAGRKRIPAGPNTADFDAAIDFLTISKSPSAFSPEEVREALHEAADLVRVLNLALEDRS